MNIAILGYGKEGQAVETYFKSRNANITIFDNFTSAELANFSLSQFDLVFRSPSVPLPGVPGVRPSSDGTYATPPNFTSSTRYFFANCPAPIIGVTGTKGKGTTCSMIADILRAAGHKVHLVGNIGIPAISVLDQISPSDIIVYELSSFQLWDLTVSPHIAVVVRVEPDHLDRHPDFADYVAAKTNLVRFQGPDDVCIYFAGNSTSVDIAAHSSAQKLPYPTSRALLHLSPSEIEDILAALRVPGQHNREDAEAALLAAISIAPDLTATAAKQALKEFQPLPHHLEFVRTLNQVDYYDDSFSASYPSMDVAISAFPDNPVIIIAGGKNRHLDLENARKRLFSAPNVKKVVLMGETAPLLAEGQNRANFGLVESLESALSLARATAEPLATPDAHAIVLLSPGAASFDMFKDFYDRGDQFKSLVKELK